MKFLKNKWVIFLLIAVFLVVIIAISSNPQSPLNFIYKAVSVPLKPLQSFFSGAATRFSKSFDYFWNYSEIDGKYREIEEENDRLKADIEEIEHYRTENEELRELLGIIEANDDYTYVTANVIAYDTDYWYSMFSIDKGSSAGIELYDCVVTSKGLVGKVVSVSPTSAKVMSIVNEESTLMARLSKTNDLVRIRGMEQFSSEILCKMDRIDETVDIAVGDSVETAESGGLYPKGLTVGKIKEIVTEDNVRYALIEPAADLRRLDKVMVMSKAEE